MNPNKPNPTESEHLPAELRQFESQLQLLAPLPGRLDRDQLLFLAGRASVHRSPAWTWPTAFAASTAVAASLLFLLVTQPPNGTPSEEFVSSPSIIEPTQIEPTHQARTRVRHSPNRPLHILSSAPNQLHRLEEFLAAGYRNAPGGSSAVDWGDGKRLTPTSIDFLINEPTKKAPTDGASNSFTSKSGADA